MTECPDRGSETYPLLGGAVVCTDPECHRYNMGWDPGA